MVEAALVSAMQAALRGHDGTLAHTARSTVGPYAVGFNGIGYLITCPSDKTLPCAGVVVCRTQHLVTHFVACKAGAAKAVTL